MVGDDENLAQTVEAMRPLLPARNFDISRKFYQELGFRPRILTDRLVEMQLGSNSFILQDYFVQQWADNFVMHMQVSDVNAWWAHIVDLDLGTRYRVKTSAPQQEDWGLVAGIVDPSGVLWRIAQIPTSR